MKSSYGKCLLDHFRHPQCVGALTADSYPDKNTHIYRAQAEVLGGDKVQLDIAVREGVIVDVKIQAYGCPALIACMSWLAMHIKGQLCNVATHISAAAMNQALELPAEKFHCALLAEEVLIKVLEK